MKRIRIKINKTRTKYTKTIEIVKIAETHTRTNTEHLLELWNIFLVEWQHRDSMFWKQVYLYFLSSLIVMLFPYIKIWKQDFTEKLPSHLFPIVGILMALLFFIICEGYIARLEALDIQIDKIRSQLPEEFKRKTVKEIRSGVWGKILNWRMTKVITRFMFIGLISLGAVVLYFTISKK